MLKDKKQDKLWWKPAIEFFAQVSGWIVFPIIAGLYLGRWIDTKFESEPLYLIVCLAVAFLITNIGLIVITIREMKKMDKPNKSKETKEI
ncbi:AtpZ/AtpI family protein [Candidatus Falkowbacteria bacterium]|jgi:F0F1-type ATP synthase assembly protein I|nr:AtpZ/AtpI family protein [Candidatus Falkowbacteria bacterium]MBT5503484.1 AtpZ/AtpI family protein [Candidatus Falkowbacteria bacterium]MBT6574067.1 AtpZ/AtpI family protein [Candidatus Falkowbacteria bacterium]MBT7348225.1 AtpZ/AtpI family protein [Candidatus Falkowbacteria bacterium]MBT7500204.1 AtpZ/AtpI family protein [Candidatus Falkowbacteria bacterium]